MNALDFFNTLPGAGDYSPFPKGRESKKFNSGKECVEGPNNCANCDCSGTVDDCRTECQSDC